MDQEQFYWQDHGSFMINTTFLGTRNASWHTLHTTVQCLFYLLHIMNIVNTINAHGLYGCMESILIDWKDWYASVSSNSGLYPG